MSSLLTSRNLGVFSIVPILALSCMVSFAAMDPGFELDLKSLNSLNAPSKVAPKAAKKKRHVKSVRTLSSKSIAGNVYTVRKGDNLFKILMREYALSNNEAEALIEEIRCENNISDIKKLKIGQKISIPPVSRSADGTLMKIRPLATDNTKPVAKVDDSDSVFHGLRLAAPLDAALEQYSVEQIKSAWEQLVPADLQVQKPLSFESKSFSLTLDPQRYPVFPTYDGARIIVDQSASIPPLVKSLITEKDPKVRIISGYSANSKQLLTSMIGAAGFYSVEPDFKLEFGVDPKLTVQSDFKIEKNADSIIRQDIVLLNSGGQSLPASLSVFLKQEGFSVLEPFARPQHYLSRTPVRQLLQVEDGKQFEIVDKLLDSLSITFKTEQNVDVFPKSKNGISLSVKVDRLFENSGKKFVVSSFGGDPIAYTLFRILETTGYRVVILEGKDDFRKVSEKMLTSLQIPAGYSKHKMLTDAGSNYSIQMSGFRLEGENVPGGSLFLTDRPLDPVIREILKEDGYDVKVR